MHLTEEQTQKGWTQNTMYTLCNNVWCNL